MELHYFLDNRKGSIYLSHSYWSTSHTEPSICWWIFENPFHLSILVCLWKKATKKKYCVQIDEDKFTPHIYTDVIFHQLIGDSYASVLRWVHADGKNNDSITRMDGKLHYVPISKSYSATIMREMKDRSG